MDPCIFTILSGLAPENLSVNLQENPPWESCVLYVLLPEVYTELDIILLLPEKAFDIKAYVLISSANIDVPRL